MSADPEIVTAVKRVIECEHEDGGQSLFECYAGPTEFCKFHRSLDDMHRWIAGALEPIIAKRVREAYDRGHRDGYADRAGHELGDGCGPDHHDCTCRNPYADGRE